MKKKMKMKTVIVFLIFEVMFTGIVFPFYILYGPFLKVRNVVVGVSMSSGNYQFIAKLFFSDEEIENILQVENKEDNEEPTVSAIEPVVIEDNEVPIEKIDISTDKFDGVALIVKDTSKVKVGYSSKFGESGETVSEMAKRYNVAAAINGGGYSDVSPTGKTGGTGGIPLGLVISNGEVVFPTNKEKYYEEQSCIFGIDGEGKMYVGPASVNTLFEKNVKEAISFAPTLIVNGDPSISDNSLAGLNPRTAIGQRKDDSIILLVIDGRQGLKLGATLKDVQKIMLNLGAINAMCLDGGGSSAMYYKDEIINNPSSVTGERAIPDIIYVEK